MDRPVIQRSAERYVGTGEGWEGRYCFSYDAHYDPANVSFGPLVACNEFVLAPGAGFGRHRHVGVDIVTVVLTGVLDDGLAVRGPGCYVLATGAGVEHDERNPGDVPTRFVQAMLLSSEADPRPAQLEVGSAAVEVVGFVLVTDGSVLLAGERLGPGDSARLGAPERLSSATGGRVLVFEVPG